MVGLSRVGESNCEFGLVVIHQIELSHYRLTFRTPLTPLLLQVRTDTVGVVLKLLVKQPTPLLLQVPVHQGMTMWIMCISIVLDIKGVKKWIFI